MAQTHMKTPWEAYFKTYSVTCILTHTSIGKISLILIDNTDLFSVSRQKPLKIHDEYATQRISILMQVAKIAKPMLSFSTGSNMYSCVFVNN